MYGFNTNYDEMGNQAQLEMEEQYRLEDEAERRAKHECLWENPNAPIITRPATVTTVTIAPKIVAPELCLWEGGDKRCGRCSDCRGEYL